MGDLADLATGYVEVGAKVEWEAVPGAAAERLLPAEATALSAEGLAALCDLAVPDAMAMLADATLGALGEVCAGLEGAVRGMADSDASIDGTAEVVAGGLAAVVGPAIKRLTAHLALLRRCGVDVGATLDPSRVPAGTTVREKGKVVRGMAACRGGNSLQLDCVSVSPCMNAININVF